MSAYEKARLENIARYETLLVERPILIQLYRNKELLKSLGLDKPFFEPVEKPRKQKSTAKKRMLEQPDNTAESPTPPQKFARSTDSSDSGTPSVRRSTRNSGKVIDYRKEKISDDYIPDSFKAGIRVSKNIGPMGREDGKRIHDPWART